MGEGRRRSGGQVPAAEGAPSRGRSSATLLGRRGVGGGGGGAAVLFFRE
jgi:hypothetical protein